MRLKGMLTLRHRRSDFADYPAVFLLIAGLFLTFTTIAVYAYAALR